MARNKTTVRKRKLIKAGSQKKAVPAWVMAKTHGKVRTNPGRRHWRRNKIRL